MFGKKKFVKREFDPTIYRPVLKCSICTGEQVAGFKDKNTGKFEEVMLIINDKDLKLFLKTYNLRESELIKEY
jgi:hypothetical protein